MGGFRYLRLKALEEAKLAKQQEDKTSSEERSLLLLSSPPVTVIMCTRKLCLVSFLSSSAAKPDRLGSIRARAMLP
ncbi:hypothetical protein OPV22_025244 [Ensete ventricosum]|uniref:Uncharacterized protein n=1 Tax=Ensete ventricosum TaxID=4639 RepID=A0AAV8Q6V8_ENSVE|nr:hypothetical protein OPV22_025244 [Ensete ventricosum]